MEEKLLILNMLKEGKITTEEAVKLLEALEKEGGNVPPSGSRINEIRDELSAKFNEIKIDEKLNRIGEKASKLAEAFGEKAGRIAEQIGENINPEKIGCSTEKFTGEFTRRMESLGQDIAESASKIADTFVYQLGSLFETGYEKYKYNSSYTYPIAEGGNIYLKTSNFSIKVIPGDTKELTISISVNSSIPQLVIDEYLKAITEDGGLRLSSEFPGRTWGRIEIQLPKSINLLSLSTGNARCEINNIEVNSLNCSTANGKIVITKCFADEIEVFTDNERVVMYDVSARTASIRTSNSKIEIEDGHLDNIDAKTSNAAIMVRSYRKGVSLNSNYVLNTSNGKIDIGMAEAEGFEYMVDAHTTNGNIDVNLKGLAYENKKNTNMQNNIQIKGENYDTASNKILINATTSNAQINIVNF